MTKNLDIGHSGIGNSLGQLEQLEIRDFLFIHNS